MMSGVNIAQWRGSIGRFNVQKIPQGTSVDSQKSLFILSSLKKYFNFIQVHMLFVLSIIYSIILLFGFSCMVITLFVLITLLRLGFGYFFSDPVFSCRDISLTLYLVLSFPKFTFLLTKKCFLVMNPMKNNIAFQLLVSGMLLIMAGIESNPGPNSTKKNRFCRLESW